MQQLELDFLRIRVARRISIVIGLGVSALIAGLATGMAFWRVLLGPW